MKKILDEAQIQRELNAKLIKKQQAKKFHYNLNDFEICGGNWKHKDWNTWMKGDENYSKCQKIVLDYIDECKKPYGSRNLSKFHLA